MDKKEIMELVDSSVRLGKHNGYCFALIDCVDKGYITTEEMKELMEEYEGKYE